MAGTMEEQFARVREEVGNEVPDGFATAETERNARREELRRNINAFLDRDDEEGLLAFVERMAHYDALTNLLNRPGFLAEAQPRLERIARLPEGLDRRTGEHVSFNVLFLDIDKFKTINDTHGHAAGDAALQEVADVLRGVLRGDDVIGRFGGEEFVVAFECSSKESLIRRNRFIVAEKIRAALESRAFHWRDQRIPLTASIGVAQLQPGEEDVNQVIRRADAAMYRAKQSGRNRVVIEEVES